MVVYLQKMFDESTVCQTQPQYGTTPVTTAASPRMTWHKLERRFVPCSPGKVVRHITQRVDMQLRALDVPGWDRSSFRSDNVGVLL